MNQTAKRVVGGIAAAIVLIAAYALLSGDTQKDTNNNANIKIGAVLPLSGDFAIIGSEIQRGIELAQDELKSDGFTPEVIYEDDKSLDPATAVSAARKLTAVDNVDVALTAIVESARPIGPVFAEAQTPLLVTWDSNEFIRETGEYTFSTGFSTEKAGEKMAAHAYRELGLRRVAVISHLDPWAEVIAPSFMEHFKSLGGEIVLSRTTQVTETDYRAFIAQAKALGTDGVYFALIPPTNAEFITQTVELELDATLLTGDALLVDVIDAVGAAADGIYYTNFYTDQAEELTEKYVAAYSEQPGDIALVSFGYDGFMALRDAALDRKAADITEALQSKLGPTRSADRVERIYQVQNGVPVLAE